MIGGGRRPPSSRRRSPADECRRSVTPPARRNLHGNAGYASVTHGSKGRFTIKASSASGNGSAEHGILKEGADPSPAAGYTSQPSASSLAAAMEEGSHADHGARVPLEASFDSHMEASSLDLALQEGTFADHGSGKVFGKQPVAFGAAMSRQDDVHSPVSLLLDGDKMDVGTGNSAPVMHSSSLGLDGRECAVGPSCPPGACDFVHAKPCGLVTHRHGCGSEVHHTTVSLHTSPSVLLNETSDVHMNLDGDGSIPSSHDTCSSPNRKTDACGNAHLKPASCSAVPNVWKKHGVVALPSLKELGDPPCHNGIAQLDDHEVKGYIERFQSALVGRLFGRHFPFFHLNNELHRRWDSFGHFKLLTLSNECFICFFDDPGARDAILLTGPWAIAGQVIGLDAWSPSFSPSTTHGFVTPIWIRFPGLPLYCWGRNSLARIASLIGDPIWIDDATSEMSRGSFARVCVRADLSKPLLGSMQVLGLEGPFLQKIEYEGLSNFCFRCGMVGHKDTKCPNLASPHGNPTAGHPGNSVQTTKASHGMLSSTCPPLGSTAVHLRMGSHGAKVHSDSPPLHSEMHEIHSPVQGTPHPQPLRENEDVFGPWMVVQNRRRKPPSLRQRDAKWLPTSRGSHKKGSVQLPEHGIARPVHSPSSQSLGKASSPQQAPILMNEDVICPSPHKHPDVVFGLNQVVSNSSIPCHNGNSHAQRPAVMLQPSSPHCPNGIVQTQQPAVVLQPQTVDQQMVGEGPVGVFSFNPPKDLDLAGSLSLARVNSGRNTPIKARGSKGKSKQAVYEVGSLLEESHKKRKPSSQTIGEDASSIVPE